MDDEINNTDGQSAFGHKLNTWWVDGGLQCGRVVVGRGYYCWGCYFSYFWNGEIHLAIVPLYCYSSQLSGGGPERSAGFCLNATQLIANMDS